MSLNTRHEVILRVLNVVALVVVFAYGIVDFIVPRVAEAYYETRYKTLVFSCDNVMREHFIAKSEATEAPSADAFRSLHAAEVGLTACHEYDKLRKRLISFGVSENRLAQIGLEAIEEKGKDVKQFVQTHEIRY